MHKSSRQTTLKPLYTKTYFVLSRYDGVKLKHCLACMLYNNYDLCNFYFVHLTHSHIHTDVLSVQ